MAEQKPQAALGYGVRGWKRRQQYAQRKNSRGKTQEEREAIRAARRRLYEQQAEKEAEGAAEIMQESEDDTVAGDGSGETLPEVGQDGHAEEVEMTREQMIQALKDAGQKVGGNIGDEALAQRVEALYAQDETEA